MPRRKVSQDLKNHIPVLRYQQFFTVKEICKIQKTLVYETLAFYNKFGVCFNLKACRQAGKRKLNVVDLKWVFNKVNSNKTLYLDEMQHHLFEA